MFRLAVVLAAFPRIDGIDVSTDSHGALSLLQFSSEADEVSDRCESFCNLTSQCGWNACKGCSFCNAEPEGCKSWCSDGHCGWKACKRCQFCGSPTTAATASPTGTPTAAPTTASTPYPTPAPSDTAPTEAACYNKDVCRDLGHTCCGVDFLTMTCAEGYEPEPVGNCGVFGARTAFTCKLSEYDDSMCEGLVGDKCCGIRGVSVNCKSGYEVVEFGKCGVLGLRTKFTCKRPELDDSKCDSGLLDACCGISGATVKCKDGYEVVETGSCGIIGARTKYSCKPSCHRVALPPASPPTAAYLARKRSLDSCWTDEAGKYLSGCSDGCKVSNDLEHAKALCAGEATCGGVTQTWKGYELRAGVGGAKDSPAYPSENSWVLNRECHSNGEYIAPGDGPACPDGVFDCGWHVERYTTCEWAYQTVKMTPFNGEDYNDNDCIRAAIEHGASQASYGPGNGECKIGNAADGKCATGKPDKCKVGWDGSAMVSANYGSNKCWTFTKPDPEAEAAAGAAAAACWVKYEGYSMPGCHDGTWPCTGFEIKWGNEFEKSKNGCLSLHYPDGSWCNGLTLTAENMFEYRHGPDLVKSDNEISWKYEC